MTPAKQIALWADKLRDISAMGLLFSKNVHDELTFRAVQTIATETLALAMGEPWERIEPLIEAAQPAHCSDKSRIRQEQKNLGVLRVLVQIWLRREAAL